MLERIEALEEEVAELNEPDPVYVTTVVVSDSIETSDVLISVLSLTPLQLRELIKERGIRHVKRDGHVYVRVDDVVNALGLGDT